MLKLQMIKESGKEKFRLICVKPKEIFFIIIYNFFDSKSISPCQFTL